MEREANLTTEQSMQPIPAERRAGLMGEGMAEVRVGISPASGQEGGASKNEIAPTGEPHLSCFRERAQ